MEAAQRYAAGDYPGAIEGFEAAVALTPEGSKTRGLLLYNLGRAYENGGDALAARRRYEASLALVRGDTRLEAQLKQRLEALSKIKAPQEAPPPIKQLKLKSKPAPKPKPEWRRAPKRNLQVEPEAELKP